MNDWVSISMFVLPPKGEQYVYHRIIITYFHDKLMYTGTAPNFHSHLWVVLFILNLKGPKM